MLPVASVNETTVYILTGLLLHDPCPVPRDARTPKALRGAGMVKSALMMNTAARVPCRVNHNEVNIMIHIH